MQVEKQTCKFRVLEGRMKDCWWLLQGGKEEARQSEECVCLGATDGRLAGAGLAKAREGRKTHLANYCV